MSADVARVKAVSQAEWLAERLRYSSVPSQIDPVHVRLAANQAEGFLGINLLLLEQVDVELPRRIFLELEEFADLEIAGGLLERHGAS